MPNHGHDIAWTDPHGAPDNAFCRRCGKVDHEADWNEPCRAGKPLTQALEGTTLACGDLWKELEAARKVQDRLMFAEQACEELLECGSWSNSFDEVVRFETAEGARHFSNASTRALAWAHLREAYRQATQTKEKTNG